MDESSSDDESNLPPGVSKEDGRSNQLTQPPVPEKVIVKKGYNPKQSKYSFTSYIKTYFVIAYCNFYFNKINC